MDGMPGCGPPSVPCAALNAAIEVNGLASVPTLVLPTALLSIYHTVCGPTPTPAPVMVMVTFWVTVPPWPSSISTV
jgi:hypothetical protein